MCGCLTCAPHWGTGQQPRHVPWLGIKPVTLCFTGWHSVHWATRARVPCVYFKYNLQPTTFPLLLHFLCCDKNSSFIILYFLHICFLKGITLLEDEKSESETEIINLNFNWAIYIMCVLTFTAYFLSFYLFGNR